MSEVWGPWAQHDGAGCPLPVGTVVEVVCEDRFGYLQSQIGRVDGDSYSSWDWSHFPELKKIVRYRKKNPEGIALLRKIAREVDGPKIPNKTLENT